MSRVPRERENEIDKVVETAKEPNERKNGWGADRRGYEGVLGVEGDIDPEL